MATFAVLTPRVAPPVAVADRTQHRKSELDSGPEPSRPPTLAGASLDQRRKRRQRVARERRHRFPNSPAGSSPGAGRAAWPRAQPGGRRGHGGGRVGGAAVASGDVACDGAVVAGARRRRGPGPWPSCGRGPSGGGAGRRGRGAGAGACRVGGCGRRWPADANVASWWRAWSVAGAVGLVVGSGVVGGSVWRGFGRRWGDGLDRRWLVVVASVVVLRGRRWLAALVCRGRRGRRSWRWGGGGAGGVWGRAGRVGGRGPVVGGVVASVARQRPG